MCKVTYPGFCEKGELLKNLAKISLALLATIFKESQNLQNKHFATIFFYFNDGTFLAQYMYIFLYASIKMFEFFHRKVVKEMGNIQAVGNFRPSKGNFYNIFPVVELCKS